MPLLLLPVLLLAFGLAWALLLPLGLWQRYRRGRARRRLRPWVARTNMWLLSGSTLLFLGGAWLAGHWVDAALAHATVGVLVGVLVGIVGLWSTRFHREDARVFYTGNRWLVLGLTVLVAARIGLGLLQALRLWSGTHAQADWLAQQGSLLAVGGLLLGYYATYNWGLFRRVPR